MPILRPWVEERVQFAVEQSLPKQFNDRLAGGDRALILLFRGVPARDARRLG
jgi:hypothetical protein